MRTSIHPAVLFALFATCCALATPTFASNEADQADDTTRSVVVAGSARFEALDSGLDSWNGQRLDVTSSSGPWTRGWRIGLAREQRFGRIEFGMEAGATLPLDDRWLVEADMSGAPDARFLPRLQGSLRLVRRLEGGLLVSAGVREASYQDGHLRQANAGIERYSGNWRFAYTASLTKVSGGSRPGHAVAVDRYFGDRNVAGIRLGSGHEQISVADGRLRFGRVRSLSLEGTYWYRPQWGFAWGLGHVRQQALYDRTWVLAGLRHAF